MNTARDVLKQCTLLYNGEVIIVSSASPYCNADFKEHISDNHQTKRLGKEIQSVLISVLTAIRITGHIRIAKIGYLDVPNDPLSQRGISEANRVAICDLSS